MAQATQIVPKFSFPYVETVINNNTVVTDSTPVEADDKVKYVFAFAGPKGIDNRWVRKSTLKSFKETNVSATLPMSNYLKCLVNLKAQLKEQLIPQLSIKLVNMVYMTLGVKG